MLKATLGAGVPPISYVAAVLADGPVGFWPLTETSGSTAVDLSGNSRNGAYSGGYTLSNTALATQFDKSVLLDGTDDWIDVADNAAWSPTGAAGQITVEAWIRPTAVNRAAQFIAAKHQEWQLRIESDGRVLWDVNYNGIKSVMSCTSPSALTAGTIYHVVATYNRATPKAELFINGVSVASSSGISYHLNPIDTSNLLRIDFAFSGQFFEAIRTIHLSGKRVILSNLNELVAALLEVFGMNKHAILMRRKVT